jgi:glutamine amidotransferase
MIAVIDYGMGNLRSVVNALRTLGEDAAVVTDPSALVSAHAIVLPGVGAFAEGMRRLEEGGFVDALNQEVRDKRKPFMGLCLGMQLLASEGQEHGTHRGLGWIDGVVRRLPAEVDGARLRVPHVGWNELEIVHRDVLLRDAVAKPTFYFVHSFVFEPDDASVVSGYSSHGVRFAATVERENVFGTQFHPEKSQRDGLALLTRFISFARAAC